MTSELYRQMIFHFVRHFALSHFFCRKVRKKNDPGIRTFGIDPVGFFGRSIFLKSFNCIFNRGNEWLRTKNIPRWGHQIWLCLRFSATSSNLILIDRQTDFLWVGELKIYFWFSAVTFSNISIEGIISFVNLFLEFNHLGKEFVW